ncbi:MAG: type I-E CRISPR-associated protein Cas5/CasD [Desulfovibrio sp.]|nr:type I-E CRISPR-associated protein Cas5/CasD [Desulfovibrio sp.]
MSFLLLWLEGPLQSWGADSRFYNRTSLPFPTRSGVLGLLCCASGRGGEQLDWLAYMANYGQTVRAYARKNVKGSTARIPPQLRDFQTVGSSYDSKDAWQDMLVPKQANGKNRSGAATKLTWRYYLQDMAYACVLEVPDEDALTFDLALKNPIWELSLGRRNCPPSDFVGRGIFNTEDTALAQADELAKEKERCEVLTVREGALEEGDEVWTINDVPLSFGSHKEYRSRQVTLFAVVPSIEGCPADENTKVEI